MPLTTIKASLGATTVTINSVDYSNRLDRVRIRISSPVENETVFSNEAQGGAFSFGTEVVNFTFSGPIKFDGAGASPFTPTSSFRDKTYTFLYTTGCSIAGTISFYDTDHDNSAGTSRRHVSQALGIGSYTWTWDET